MSIIEELHLISVKLLLDFLNDFSVTVSDLIFFSKPRLVWINKVKTVFKNIPQNIRYRLSPITPIIYTLI